MESSISNQVAEPTRNVSNRANRWTAADHSSAKMGLFEQILNIPVTSELFKQQSLRETEPSDAERDIGSEPTKDAERTDESARQIDQDESEAPDTGPAANASYLQSQLTVPVRENEIDGGTDIVSEKQPAILDENNTSESTQKSTGTQIPGERKLAQQSGDVEAEFDNRSGLPNRANESVRETVQSELVDPKDHRDSKKTKPVVAIDGEPLGSKIELPSDVSVTTSKDLPQPTEGKNASEGKARAEEQDLRSLPAEEIHPNEAKRRDKWFEHSPNEASSEATRPIDQTPTAFENDTNSLATQGRELRAEQSVLNDVQHSTGIDSTPLSAAENAFGSATAALAGSSNGPAGPSTASRSTANAQFHNGAQSADIAARENGTGGLGMSAADAKGNSVKDGKSDAALQSDETRQLTQQERIRLVQRVARSFSRLTAEGGQISLRLHPPQLGSLNVTVRIEGRTMSARLQTETAAARDAIIENLPVLKQRLAEQGMDVQQFQVELAGNPADFSNSSFSQSSNQPESQFTRQPPNYRVDYRRLSTQADLSNQANAVQQLGNVGPNHGMLAVGSLDLKV